MNIEEKKFFLRKVQNCWIGIFAYCGLPAPDFNNFTDKDIAKVEAFRFGDEGLEKLFAQLEEARYFYQHLAVVK